MAKEKIWGWKGKLTTLDKLAKVKGTNIWVGPQKDLAETLNEDENLLFKEYKKLIKYIIWKIKTIGEENFNDLITWTVSMQNVNLKKEEINSFIDSLKESIKDDVALKELIQKENKNAKAVLKAMYMLRRFDKDFLKNTKF